MRVFVAVLLVVFVCVASSGAADRKQFSDEPVKMGTSVERSPVQQDSVRTVTTPLAAEAQETSVNWSVLAGGGGQVSSGALTVNGTIGQALVGTMVSGETTVHGGFWQDFASLECCEHRGNVDHKLTTSGTAITIIDVTYLVSMLFRAGPEAPCMTEADANGDGRINIQDLTFLVALLFRGGPEPPPC